MMIKDFIKEVKKAFGDDVEFKATSISTNHAKLLEVYI